MTNFAYPGRTGLDWTISNFFNKEEVRFLIIYSNAPYFVGNELNSEFNFVSNERFGLRTFDNDKLVSTCTDLGVNLPRYIIGGRNQVPTVTTTFKTIGVMLTSSPFNYNISSAWLNEYTATFTSVDEIEFEVPDTLDSSDLFFLAEPNRFFADNIFFTGDGNYSLLVTSPGIKTVTVQGVSPNRPIGTVITFRPMGAVLMTIESLIGTINSGNSSTFQFNLLPGRQNVLTF